MTRPTPVHGAPQPPACSRGICGESAGRLEVPGTRETTPDLGSPPWALVVSNHRPPPCKGDLAGPDDLHLSQHHSGRAALLSLKASRRFALFLDP